MSKWLYITRSFKNVRSFNVWKYHYFFKKPDYAYYKGNKFFIYDDENEIPDILNTIKKMNNEELKKIIENNNKLFKNNIDPIAIAQYIEKQLSDKKFI